MKDQFDIWFKFIQATNAPSDDVLKKQILVLKAVKHMENILSEYKSTDLTVRMLPKLAAQMNRVSDSMNQCRDGFARTVGVMTRDYMTSLVTTCPKTMKAYGLKTVFFLSARSLNRLNSS